MMAIHAPEPRHVCGIADTGRLAFAQAFGSLFPDTALQAYLGRTYGRAKIEMSLGKTGNRYLVASEGDRVVGFIKAKIDCPHPSLAAVGHQLQKLYVHPDTQGKGIGEALLVALLAEMPGAAWWLQVYAGNERARRFYGR